MKWIAAQLNALHPDRAWRVFDAENYEPQNGRSVYRFFELFDLPNLPRVGELMNAASEGRVSVTPPFKPYLEEKMWFALFWMQPLREFWRRELGEKYFLKLQQVIPYTWLLDPTPLPQHAVIPRLEIHDWREAARFSQKERDLLLKVSGFSPLGWGAEVSRSARTCRTANGKSKSSTRSETFEQSPTLMQRFHKGRLVEQRYWDSETGELQDDARPSSTLPVLLRRNGQGQNARRARHRCSRRQETPPRNARRDSRADAICQSVK